MDRDRKWLAPVDDTEAIREELDGGGTAAPFRREFAFTPADFNVIARLLNETTGIALAPNKRDMVYARLAKRLRVLGLTRFRDYRDRLTGAEGEAELAHLFNALTTNTTRFFRENHHFVHLAEQALPAIRAAAKTSVREKLRIWSAGCSSGEEAYSIAITVLEAIPDVNRWDARILGTDIDANMLVCARKGVYSIEQVAMVPPELRARYLESHGEGAHAVVSDALRRLIAFNSLNLMSDWPMRRPFDIVFCRNVMIYFDKATQRQLQTRFASVLVPGGYLYLGHAESLDVTVEGFELTDRNVYRRTA